MNDLWTEILQDASLGGVVFPLRARRFSGGRDGARLQFPHQPGQGVDDTGRQPRSLELSIELFADVNPDHYPGLYRELLAVFEDDVQLAEVEYVDPILPPMSVKVWGYEVSEEAGARNGATITVSIEEVTQDVDGAALTPRRSARVAASETSLELDDALAQLGLSDEDVKTSFAAAGAPLGGEEAAAIAPGEVFSTLTTTFSEALSTGVRTVDELAALSDTMRRRVTGVTSLSALRTTAGWRAYSAALTLVDALGELAEASAARAVPIVEMVLTSETSAAELAARLYGDRGRAAEIVTRNPTRRPHAYPAGAVVRVAQR